MKVLIIGSSGLLGKELYYFLKKKKIKVFHNGLNKRKLNLSYERNIKKLLKINPDLIINAAAITDIELCENAKKKTTLINTGLLKKIFFLKSKYDLNFKLIQFSTDQLYNSEKPSKESDKINIYNNYSLQKFLAEKICLKNESLIFRTNFFGKSISKNKSFTDWIFEIFQSNKDFYLFKDITFNPLRINTICNIIYTIIIKKKIHINGIYNLGSVGKISKSNFAIFFAKKAKVFHENFQVCNYKKILKTKRSKNMTMNINLFKKKFKIKLPKIRDQIKSEALNYK
ncbi:sugar nucleotide-binding protein [Pelagibacterales bacterium SAG-MED09]|nr:sugar nucleotide-binding protein [Pelagibacterales bacterium SAG-MED09]